MNVHSNMIIRFIRNGITRKPLLSQMILAGCISGSGDRLAQYITKKDEWDMLRTLRFSILSFTFIAPTTYNWYRILERLKGPKNIVVFKKLLVDQLIFSPIFNAAILFNLRFLELWSSSKSFNRMVEDWPHIYANSIKVWPIVIFINLYFLPLKYRVIWNQAFAFFWNAYLSYGTQTRPPDHLEQLY